MVTRSIVDSRCSIAVAIDTMRAVAANSTGLFEERGGGMAGDVDAAATQLIERFEGYLAHEANAAPHTVKGYNWAS